jgi:O-antigen/teichoic acid export membrane protein
MNLLQKQGFYNSIILYTGTALGFINLIFLFQRYLSIEQIGLFNLLIAISGIYAQLASAGSSNIILRYFPYFREKNEGFVSFVAMLCIAAFAILTLLFVAFRSPIIHYYEQKPGSSLLVQYYNYIIPLSFFTLVYLVLESLARAVFKNVLSAFLKEILLRLFTLAAVILVALKMLHYDGFMTIYLWGNAVIALILLLSIWKEEHFKLKRLSPSVSEKRGELMSYGMFALLSGSTVVLIQNIDVFMLSALTNDAAVGYYSTFFSLAIVINLPARALSRTSYQIISNAWQENDMAKIGKIYHKTSVVQCLLGCLLLVGLIVNRENIVLLLHKPGYNQYFDVFIIVGVAFLVDITGGLNSHIISSSKYYRLITLLLSLAVLLCGALNWVLIPKIGMAGAAIAYLLTMFLLNFSYWLFIKIKFKLQPFDRSFLIVFVIASISLAIGLYIPKLNNFIIDMGVRSLVVGLVYAILAYWFKISEDINQVFDKFIFKR